MSDLQSWNDPKQNRESGGKDAEQTPYAPAQETEDNNAATDNGD